MLRVVLALAAAAAVGVLLAGCGGGTGTVTVTTAAPTVTVTQTATASEPATTTEPDTATVPETETGRTGEEAVGFVDPCEYVTASDIGKALGGKFEKGVSSQPAEGVGACIWKAKSGPQFAGVLAFESARAFPGGWRRLSKDEPWTDADYQPFWELLGVRAPDVGQAGWSTFGCSRVVPGNRDEAFAILLFVLGHAPTEAQTQKVWNILDEITTACVAY